jgi:hypothetical protein
MAITAPEEQRATMRAAKPRSHPPLDTPTEAAPESVCRTARNDFLSLFGGTNSTVADIGPVGCFSPQAQIAAAEVRRFIRLLRAAWLYLCRNPSGDSP